MSVFVSKSVSAYALGSSKDEQHGRAGNKTKTFVSRKDAKKIKNMSHIGPFAA